MVAYRWNGTWKVMNPSPDGIIKTKLEVSTVRKTRVILSILSCALMLAMFFATPASVRANSIPATNIALYADVEIHGGPFFTGGWLPPRQGYEVEIDTIIDEVFFPSGRQWNRGPVWWDSTDWEDRFITLTLDGIFEIESFIIQADNNDQYKLYYWNLDSENWELVWHLPTKGSWVMYTRPNPNDNTERYMLPENIITNALKFEGDMDNSDRLFSVSEIQAYGWEVVTATVDFDPDTLNLKSKGKWVTVYIEFPEGFDITDIDIATVMLNDVVNAEPFPFAIGDYDNDGIPDLMVKFNRALVQANLDLGDEIEITISGELYNGILFTGMDTIRVI